MELTAETRLPLWSERGDTFLSRECFSQSAFPSQQLKSRLFRSRPRSAPSALPLGALEEILEHWEGTGSTGNARRELGGRVGAAAVSKKEHWEGCQELWGGTALPVPAQCSQHPSTACQEEGHWQGTGRELLSTLQGAAAPGVTREEGEVPPVPLQCPPKRGLKEKTDLNGEGKAFL